MRLGRCGEPARCGAAGRVRACVDAIPRLSNVSVPASVPGEGGAGDVPGRCGERWCGRRRGRWSRGPQPVSPGARALRPPLRMRAAARARGSTRWTCTVERLLRRFFPRRVLSVLSLGILSEGVPCRRHPGASPRRHSPSPFFSHDQVVFCHGHALTFPDCNCLTFFLFSFLLLLQTNSLSWKPKGKSDGVLGCFPPEGLGRES